MALTMMRIIQFIITENTVPSAKEKFLDKIKQYKFLIIVLILLIIAKTVIANFDVIKETYKRRKKRNGRCMVGTVVLDIQDRGNLLIG